ncbi:LysE family translocator [Pseudonocardia phyllosphaerae]|uniref:LysE family translocator n=1 Tax=Pseudonocardia phyllosphaerae TaxID=3390502 RepID=UPI00397C58E4
MPTASATVTFLLGSLVFVMIPGPSVFFILGRAIALGRRAALVTAAGNLAGVLVFVVAVSFGVGVLIERLAVALTVLRYLGAAYLIWLGGQAFRHRHQLVEALNDPTKHPSRRRGFWEGVVVGLTNPKAIVFFAAILPQFVDPAAGSPVTQMLVLGLLFCLLASTMDVVWASAAGTARDWFATSPTRLRRLGGTGGLIMIGMGIGVAATGNQS